PTASTCIYTLSLQTLFRSPDELRNNVRGWPQAVQKANHEVPTHRPNASAPYSTRPAIHPMMNAVGGTTLHYWAQSWRLNPWDFKDRKSTRLNSSHDQISYA